MITPIYHTQYHEKPIETSHLEQRIIIRCIPLQRFKFFDFRFELGDFGLHVTDWPFGTKFYEFKIFFDDVKHVGVLRLQVGHDVVKEMRVARVGLENIVECSKNRGNVPLADKNIREKATKPSKSITKRRIT